ncbi:MAG: hypothetical protein IPN76_21860 [Saprospiraceae bacterium]|jgi:hypothetical protein|nr:hypothetical protein [Saprospiraceae bacterium]
MNELFYCFIAAWFHCYVDENTRWNAKNATYLPKAKAMAQNTGINLKIVPSNGVAAKAAKWL